MTVLTPAPPERNARCPCGSGRKYKHCCLPKDEAAAAVARAEARAAAEAEAVAPAGDDGVAAPASKVRHQTAQPWKAHTSRGFVSKSRTPRKVGGG